MLSICFYFIQDRHFLLKAESFQQKTMQGLEGFSTGGKEYEKIRPTYTDEVVDVVYKEVMSTKLSNMRHENIIYNVLELGAGTGKFTELLMKKSPPLVNVLATDPSQDFLDILNSKGLPIETKIARGDAIPLPDASVRHVLCAQSFHWFSDDAGMKEIKRVLVPGGKLIVIFNREESEGWLKIAHQHQGEVRRRFGTESKVWIYTGEWEKDIKKAEYFALEKHLSLDGVEFRGDLDKMMEFFATMSTYKMVPNQEERKQYLQELRNLIKDFPGVDTNNMLLPFSTQCYIYVPL